MVVTVDRRTLLKRLSAMALSAPAASSWMNVAPSWAANGGTLRIGVPESFSSLNPYKKIGRLDYNAVINIFDTLVTYGPDYVPAPALAESWKQTENTTWRFMLRKGVSFHDGTPFDAQAAKYSIEKMRTSNFGAQFKPISDVVVIDPATIEMKTSAPFPTLVAQLTQQYASIVSPKAYESTGEQFGRKPVGSGPFKVDSFDPSRELVLVKNSAYWGKDSAGNPLPHIDKVVWRVLPDNDTAALALQNGEIDFLYAVPIAMAGSLSKDPNIKVLETPTLGWNYVMFNVQTAPFNNVHLRRAVQLAVNRQAIIDTVTFGRGVPALGPIAPRSWAYDPVVETTGPYGATARPEKAKAELKAAGMPDGFEFTVIYPAEAPFDAMAQAIQGQLEQVGIRTKLEGKDIGAALDDLFASRFSALLIDWSGRIDEAMSLPSFFASDGGNNFGKYSNPKVDSLLMQAGNASEIAKRKQLYQEVQKLIVEDSPHLWISVPTEIRAMRSNVEGFVNYGDVRLRAATVSLK